MLLHWLIYLGGGLMSGGINAVAGGGSLFVFPLMLSLGLPPIVANATTSLTLEPGTISSVVGYRAHIRKLPVIYYLYLIPAFFGGLFGAVLLVKTTNLTFGRIAPYFMAAAVLLIIFQPRIQEKIYRRGVAKRHHVLVTVFVFLLLLLISIYGGYFGAGFSVVVLGALGLTRLSDIQQMNGLKNLIGFTLGVSDIYYIIHGLIDWRLVPAFMIGNAVGGYFTSVYSSRLPSRLLRYSIIAIATTLTLYLFYKYH